MSLHNVKQFVIENFEGEDNQLFMSRILLEYERFVKLKEDEPRIVKVVLNAKYRDGGTCEYEDELNRKYFRWEPTKMVYNAHPKRNMGIDAPDCEWIKKIPVLLEIVEKF